MSSQAEQSKELPSLSHHFLQLRIYAHEVCPSWASFLQKVIFFYHKKSILSGFLPTLFTL